MIVRIGLLLGLLSLVVGCAHLGVAVGEPKPAAVARETPVSRSQILAVQHTLRELRYDVGVPDGVLGSKTIAAIRAYQKDQKLAVDGKLTEALISRLGNQRPAPAVASLPNYQLGETYTYSDGSTERVQKLGATVGFAVNAGEVRERALSYLVVSEPGVRADAPSDFLQPLEPGKTGEYRLYRPSADGEQESLVRCSVEGTVETVVPAGTFDAVQTICRETVEGTPRAEWQWFYAPSLHQIVRQITTVEGGDPMTRDLVAVQPSTDTWPTAARTGFDWAVVNALENDSKTAPVAWSSTGVRARFKVEVDHAPADYHSFVPGGSAEADCKRYTLQRVDPKSAGMDYPGVACFLQGKWLIPSRRPYVFAVPPKGLTGAVAKPASGASTTQGSAASPPR